MNREKRTLNYATIIIPIFVVLALIISTAYSYYKSIEVARARASEQFLNTLEAGKNNIDMRFAESIADAKSTAYLIYRTGPDEENMRNSIGYQLLHTKAAAGYIFNENGTKMFGSGDLNLPFADIVKKVLDTNEPAASDLILVDDGEYRFSVAVPYKFDSGSTSVLMFVYPQLALLDLVSAPVLGGRGRMAIVRRDGSFIARMGNTSDDYYVGKIDPDKLKQAQMELTEIPTDKGDQKLLISGAELGYNDWILVCMASEELINQRARESTTIIIMFSLISLLLMGVLFGMIYCEMKKWTSGLRIQREKFRIAVNQSSRAAFEYDRQKNTFAIISESENISLPHGNKEISLSTLMNMVYPADREDARTAIGFLNKKECGTATVRMSNLSGTAKYNWYHITATRLASVGGKVDLIIGSLENIDEQENERRYLRQRATTDSLTGLLNRAETERTINKHIANLKLDEQSAFIIIDLDDFKRVNDSFGHGCGDKMLQFFAEKVKNTFRLGDIIGRLGGDEFIVYMAFTPDNEIVERRLMELSNNLSLRRADDGMLPEVSSCAGYVMARPGDNFESVYLRADVALYKAKDLGENKFYQGE